jgi:hypothetical protein
MANGNGFKLDKHIPVALLLAIALQTCGIIWGAAKLDSRVGSLETWARRQEAASAASSLKVDTQQAAMAVKIDDVNLRLARIEGMLIKKGVRI